MKFKERHNLNCKSKNIIKKFRQKSIFLIIKMENNNKMRYNNKF